MSAVLSEQDLFEILEDVYDVAPKWYNFGLALGVSPHTLDSIKRQNYQDDGDCLRDVLREWLKGVTNENRSWGTLAKALRTRTVRMNEVAVQLERKYLRRSPYDVQSFLQPSYSIDRLNQRVPLSTDDQLRGKGDTAQEDSMLQMMQQMMQREYGERFNRLEEENKTLKNDFQKLRDEIKDKDDRIKSLERQLQNVKGMTRKYRKVLEDAKKKGECNRAYKDWLYTGLITALAAVCGGALVAVCGFTAPVIAGAAVVSGMGGAAVGYGISHVMQVDTPLQQEVNQLLKELKSD